jgi:peptidoglycan lytic transglycosylase G
MKKRTTRMIIFLATLLIFFGGIGAACYAWLGRQSSSSPSGGVTLSAPSSIEDWGVSLYLDFRRSELNAPAGSDPAAIVFTVEPGESVGQIATRLQTEGLVRDAQLFRLYLRYAKLDSGVEAGQFTLKKTMTIAEIAQALQSGKRDELTLTIPEGRRLEEVAALVEQQTPISATTFLSLARNAGQWASQYPFLAELPPDASLEGYLFPDTYRLPKDVTASDVIARMLANLDHRITPVMRDELASQKRTLFEAVTLASIVEREAVVENERPLIAGVYMNRLVSGMALDADPTVQYGIASAKKQAPWWPQLTQEDYRAAKSPYNTYLNPGLPPGPIANPGLSSLQAAIEPARTPYFFFRAACSRDGTHLFSKTLEEHAAKACP